MIEWFEIDDEKSSGECFDNQNWLLLEIITDLMEKLVTPIKRNVWE